MVTAPHSVSRLLLAGGVISGAIAVLHVVVIAVIFLLRGASVFPQLAVLLTKPGAIPIRYAAFSAVSFVAGSCYALGTWRAWRRSGGRSGRR